MDGQRCKFKQMRRKNIFFWLLTFIFLTTYNFGLNNGPLNSFFKINKIELNGIENAEILTIKEKLEKFKGQNIVFIDQKKLINQIYNLDFVRDIKIKKIYPDKIIITIKEYKPLGIYLDDEAKYILLENDRALKSSNDKFSYLPFVYGKHANKNFSLFYSILEESNFQTDIVDNFKYHETNRWDILLKNGKLVKLPSERDRTIESLKKFLSIYQKEKFKKFKVFDFRVKNQLIIK